MKSAIILLFLSSSFYQSLQGQGMWDNNWLFGHNAIMDGDSVTGTIINFSTKPIAIIPVVKEMEFSSTGLSMSDSTGKLIFYSNGCCIANAQNDTMPGSDSIGQAVLLSSYCDYGAPLQQGIIALPKPGSSSIYYMFNLDLDKAYWNSMGMYFPLAPQRLYYNIIDMSLEDGLGRVVKKNTLLIQDTFSRGTLQAHRHANGYDWWLLVPKSHTNCYHTVLFSSEGAVDTFLQCTGHIWSDEDNGGQAVFSPDGKKYARFRGNNGLNIYDFDTQTGVLSNAINIPLPDSFGFNGVAFSSNSRFLYATAYTVLYQFDMRAPDIESTKQTIAWWQHPTPTLMYNTLFYQARLAPDGKIYISGSNNSQHLHIIHKPNCPGEQCDFEQYAVEMKSINAFTMPNFPHFRNWSNEDSCVISSIKNEIGVVDTRMKLSPNPATSHFTIALPRPTEATIIVTNVRGQVVLNQKMNNQTFDVSLEDWIPGIYLVQVRQTNGKSWIGKIIKMVE